MSCGLFEEGQFISFRGIWCVYNYFEDYSTFCFTKKAVSDIFKIVEDFFTNEKFITERFWLNSERVDFSL